jgi:hypothetical protein
MTSFAAAVTALVTMTVALSAGAQPMSQAVHVVYIEASTANRWRVEEFPARINAKSIDVTLLRRYEFDKSAEVSKAIQMAATRPTTVVLQECGAYFPGSLPNYERDFESWVSALQAAGARVIVSTVVPLAQPVDAMGRFKAFVKEDVLRRPSASEQVSAFNDWLRGMAARRGVVLLDLERVLRTDESNRHMRPEFDSGDGLHVNAAAFALMDAELKRTLTASGILP